MAGVITGITTLVILGLLSLVFAGEKCDRNRTHVSDSVLQRLFNLVYENQVHTDDPTIPGETKIKRKGSYKNVIKLNRFGDSLQTALRWAININDQNVFATMWVTIVLLEAHLYGTAPRPSDEQLISSLEYCSEFGDIVKPYNNSLMLFWKYVYDETSHSYRTVPTGYLELLNLVKATLPNNPSSQQTIGYRNLQTIMTVFSEVTRIFTGFDNIGDIVFSFLQQFGTYNIHPDVDDTAAWLGIGSLLHILDDEFLPVFNKWNNYNSNISSIFNAIQENAYRPFSSDPVANTIDPHSYYFLRHFLDDAKSAGKDVALVTTWFTEVKEFKAKTVDFLSYKTVNDVDLTVCANVINAITVSILSGLVSPEVLQDPELRNIYQSTSEMIGYLINSNFSNRQDLAFPYYTSLFQFYWFLARSVSIMDIYKLKSPLPLDVMDVVYNNLRQALEGEATRFLISSVKQNKDDGSLYFDDFLGNGDLTDDNKPITRGEDRIFTTAMAANALMYTWLSFDSDSRTSVWKSHTLDIVKKIVKGCIMWLERYALEAHFKPWGVFFVNPFKGTQIPPYRYPANIFVEIPHPYTYQMMTTLEELVGVRGYIPKSDYMAIINTTHFGRPTPTVFKGFNDPDFQEMLFWSSDAYTYAVTLLALSRFKVISETHDNDC